ncbi:iridoid oxidase [Ziziphus jujuba]|uniref:Iridoid oxidase n=2 Tax=Ziziphus jujuba TaxID=326968 RepID=A0AC41ZMA4_ZIZJJ|nr:iridoid oxidase [Ziziphus jujuba]
MELSFSFPFSSVLLLLPVLLLLSLRLVIIQSSRKETKQRPPGPKGWPVIGNMLDLGAKPHQTLFNLRARYGPDLLWLKLGSMNTMVVQSAKAAEQLLKNQDASFCDRKCPHALTSHNYKNGTIAFGRYGSYWRVLRRICTMEFLVNKRVNDMAPVRRKCVDAMIQFMEEDSAAARARGESGAVNLTRYVFVMGFNVVGNFVFSKDLLDPNCREGKEFFVAVDKIIELMGKPNVADFLPFLKWLDPQGVKRNMTKHMAKALEIAGRFLKERVEERRLGKRRDIKDFMEVLLEYESDGKVGAPDKISIDKNISIILLEMFMAGSETTSSTIEWAMTELFRSPESMRKAKQELDQVVGPNRKVEESDIHNLPYLQAVVKESMRLHPAVPLLIPRNAIEDTNFMGYVIPKDTQIFVNVWGIARDPESWDEPLCFKPERFIGSNIEYKGQNFEFLPFGSGRRICMGIPLAQRVVHFALASLLHTFEWDLDSDQANLNRGERVGISLRKLIPLQAIPKKRN